MDDKLIFRAAVAYHKLLTNMSKNKATNTNFSQHLCNVKNIMNEIGIWAERLEIVQNKGWKSSTKFLKQAMLTRLVRKAANHFSVLESELLQENELVIPPIQELWQEIKSLNGLFDTCEYKKGYLSIVTEPITLEHNGNSLDLGRFQISLDLKTDMAIKTYEHLISMKALEPNRSPAEDDLVHPHIRGTEPCLGEALGLVQEPFVLGNIELVFMNLCSMIKTYNPVSPFRSIEDWYDEGCTCFCCGEEICEDESYSCASCDHTLCDGCSMYCNRCEETHCENCTGYVCGWCEEHICKGCEQYKCKDCGMHLCSECIYECCETYCEDCNPICDSCTGSYCPSCEGGECTECNKIYCESCSLACEICDANTCDNCGNACSKCDHPICPECTRNCENCGKDFCKECIDEDECSLLKEKVK